MPKFVKAVNPRVLVNVEGISHYPRWIRNAALCIQRRRTRGTIPPEAAQVA